MVRMLSRYTVVTLVLACHLFGCRETANRSNNQSSSNTQLSVVNDPKTYACEQDSDCTSVQAGCCTCGNNGTATAINKAYENEWIAYWRDVAPSCKNTGCLTVVSSDPTCYEPAACVNSKCSLRRVCSKGIPVYGYSCSAGTHATLLACAPCQGMTADVGYVHAVTDAACFRTQSGGDVACLCQSDSKTKWTECQ